MTGPVEFKVRITLIGKCWPERDYEKKVEALANIDAQLHDAVWLGIETIASNIFGHIEKMDSDVDIVPPVWLEEDWRNNP